MPVQHPNLWSSILGDNLVAPQAPAIIDDAMIAAINRRVSALPWNPTQQQVLDAVNDGNPGLGFTWEPGVVFPNLLPDLAKVKLHTQLHAQPLDFNESRANFFDANALVADQVSANLRGQNHLAYILGRNYDHDDIAGIGALADTEHFKAIVAAFAHDDPYHLTPAHKQAFLTEVVEEVDNLRAAGISNADISTAILSVAEPAQVDAILALYANGEALDGQQAMLLEHFPDLARLGIGFARLVPDFFADNDALHQAVLAALGRTPLSKMQAQFRAVMNELYVPADRPLSGGIADAIGVFVAKVPAAGIADIELMQNCLAAVPTIPAQALQAFNDAVVGQVGRLLAAVNNAADLNQVLLLLVGVDGQLALQVELAKPAVVENLFGKNIALADIVAAHRGITAEALFQPFITEIAGLDLTLPASFARVQALMTLVANGAVIPDAQRDALYAAVLTRANDLLGNATGTTFTNVANILATCGGNLNTSLADYNRVMGLINRGVRFAQFQTVQGVDLAALRTLLFQTNLNTLIPAGLTQANLAIIHSFVHGDPPIDPALKTAFQAKFDLATVEGLLTRNPVSFTIGQVSALHTGQIAYDHADNQKFRKELLDQIGLQAYLDSLQHNPANNTWSHQPHPPAAAVAGVNADVVRAHLETLRSRFQRFDSRTVVGVQAAAASGEQHGLQVFQEVLKTNYAKVVQVCGGRDAVNRLALTAMAPRTQESQRIEDFKMRIDAATTAAHLAGIHQDINALNVSPAQKQAIREAVEQHLKTPATLLRLLEAGVQLDQFALITQGAVSARLLAELVSVADVTIFDRLLAQVQAHHLDEASFANDINEKFVALVSRSVITPTNFAAVKAFLDGHLQPPLPVDLLGTLTQKRDLFLAGLAQSPLKPVELQKALQEYKTAYHALAQAAAFNTAVFGDPVQAPELGHLPSLLAKGLSFDDLVAVQGAGITADQLKAKAVHHATLEIDRLASIVVAGIPTDQDKLRHQDDFKRLARVFIAIGDPALQAPLRQTVNSQALALLRAGVDPKDLLAIDPSLTADELYARVSTRGAIADVAERLKLQGLLQRERVSEADPLPFARGLSQVTRSQINELVSAVGATFYERHRALAAALQEMTRLYPAYVSAQGIVGADPAIKSRIESDYLRVFQEEIKKSNDSRPQRLRDQGIDPDEMVTDAKVARAAVLQLRRGIEALKKAAVGAHSVGRLKSTLSSLQQKLQRLMPIETEADRNAADELLKALQKIQAADLALWPERFADQRQRALELLEMASKKIDAIDYLLNSPLTNRLPEESAKELSHDRQELQALVSLLKQRIQENSEDVTPLATGFEQLKTALQAELARVTPDAVKGKVSTAVLGPALSQHGNDLTDLQTVQGFIADDARVTLANQTANKRIVNGGDLPGKPHAVVLSGQGEKAVCAITVLEEGQRGVAVRLDQQPVRVVGQGLRSVVSRSRWGRTGVKGFTEADLVLAFEAGSALARAYKEQVAQKHPMNFFGEPPAEKVVVRGSYTPKPGMTADQLREVWFNVAVMMCAEAELGPEAFDTNCPGYRDFQATKRELVKKLGGDYPEFSRRLEGASRRSAVAPGQRASPDAFRADLEKLERDLGRSDLAPKRRPQP